MSASSRYSIAVFSSFVVAQSGERESGIDEGQIWLGSGSDKEDSAVLLKVRVDGIDNTISAGESFTVSPKVLFCSL